MAMPEEDMKQLASCFTELKVNPKMDTAEDFEQWMTDYVVGKLRLKGQEIVKNQEPIRNPSSSSGKISSGATHVLHTPKIFAFSGEGDHTDAAFEAWRYEVLTLLREGSYTDKIVTTAVKKSLRGEAAKVVRRLGVDSSTQQILNKFQVIYGRVEDPSDLLTEFHKATQGPSESVSAWCCRIEDLLHRALEEDPSHLTRPEETLRLKFYSGLQKDIQDRIRHLKAHLRDFDSLLFEARRAEMEGKGSVTSLDKKSAQVRLVQADDMKSEMDTLKASICTLTTKMSEMTDTLRDIKESPKQSPWTGNNTSNRGGSRNRGNYRQRNWNGNQQGNWNGNGQWDHGPSHSQNYNQNSSSQNTSGQQSGSNKSAPESAQNHGGARPRQPITCHRCGQLGHKAYGCCVDLTSSDSLNMVESA